LLDKLEWRIPAKAHFGGEIREAVEGLRAGVDVPGGCRSKFYAHRLDLRPYGIDAMLHVDCKRGDGVHKGELLDTGKKPFTQILADIERVSNGNPLDFEVMRVDPAVDVPGVPVGYFHRFARVQFRQWSANIASVPIVERSEMGKRDIQTVYYGRRPNCIRVYNKIAEWQHQYHQAYKVRTILPSDFPDLLEALSDTGVPELDGMEFPIWRDGDGNYICLQTLKRLFGTKVIVPHDQRVRSLGQDPGDRIPSFSEVFGHSEGDVLTRVERQVSADRVESLLLNNGDRHARFYTDDYPKAVTDTHGNSSPGIKLRQLQQRIAEVNPFERLMLEPGSLEECPTVPDKFRARDFAVINGLRWLVITKGMQFARAELNRRSKGNGGKLLEKYAQFLPIEILPQPLTREVIKRADGSSAVLTENQLYEMYRHSMTRQLAA
jgi:hypothetical protein